MEHDEIRFRFLRVLYEKYYGGHARLPLNPTEIIKEAGLDSINQNLVNGDVIYLRDKGLVNGEYTLGPTLPYYVTISSYGIDTVEMIMKESLQVIEQNAEGLMNEEIKEIQKEQEPPKKYAKLWSYAKDHPDLIMTIIEKATKFISGIAF